MVMLLKLKLSEKIKQHKYTKTLRAIPFVFTYLNAIFGFLSILKALEENYIAAAYYILAAACMDGIDGRLARAFNSVSCVGMELDSLCDAISFCLAPTVLLYCWYPGFIGMGAQAALMIYLCAGLYRLARFNVTVEKQQYYFIGLPTPIAAFFISSLVIYDRWIESHIVRLLLYKSVLFPLIMIIALLMISPFRFYSFKRYRLQAGHTYILGALVMLVSAWLIMQGYPVLLMLVCSYIITNLIFHIKLIFKM
jgi:CDP-diacylglycerol---serine O-phosphatidyltransferase